MPAHPYDKAIPLVLIAVLSYILAGCQSIRAAQIGSTPTVNSYSTIRGNLALILSATITPEDAGNASSTSLPSLIPTLEPTLTPQPAPFLDRFVASLVNGHTNQVVGVFVDGVLALKVVQQPATDPGYISTDEGVATYFTQVMSMTGNSGLLAHNYLAGIYYFNLKPGQSVVLIYGDGHTAEYAVSDIDQFQVLSPTSPSSNFVNMSTGETLTATDLFYLVYSGSSRTTFQTCIAQGNNLGEIIRDRYAGMNII